MPHHHLTLKSETVLGVIAICCVQNGSAINALLISTSIARVHHFTSSELNDDCLEKQGQISSFCLTCTCMRLQGSSRKGQLVIWCDSRNFHRVFPVFSAKQTQFHLGKECMALCQQTFRQLWITLQRKAVWEISLPGYTQEKIYYERQRHENFRTGQRQLSTQAERSDVHTANCLKYLNLIT